MIVLDVSVFAKLFLDESDHAEAEALFTYVTEHDIAFIAPTLIVYEALSIGLRHDVPFQSILSLLESARAAGLQILEPGIEELMTAERSATAGNKAAGYPSLQDSIYHAMAIERGGMFITADRRHVTKAGTFGNVTLLADWKPG